MKAIRKRFLIVAMIAIGGLALSACASGSSATTSGSANAGSPLPDSVDLKGQTVVSLFTSMNNDYYGSWNVGAQRAVEAFNGKYVSQTNEGDPATELSQFQQQVDAGVKIMFVTAPDPANVPQMAKIAHENNVCLVNTWEQPPWTTPFDTGDQYVSYISPAGVDDAYGVAKALFDKMGGKGNVVHLTGHAGGTADLQRSAGFTKALKEYPGINVVAEEPGEWNRDDARKAMVGIISRVGVNEIGGVFGQNDDVAIGALNALTEAGVATNSLPPIVGIDGSQSAIDLIKAGQLYGTHSTLPQWMAGFSFVQALDFCKGGKVDPLNRNIWTGGVFVTADNVQSYVDTYTGDNNPYDWVKMSRVAHPNDWDPQNQVRAMNIEENWTPVAPKPAGFVLPAAYAAALPTMGAINAEWAAHWKLVRP